MVRLVPRPVRTLAQMLVGTAVLRLLGTTAQRTPVRTALKSLRTPAPKRGLATSAGGALPAIRLLEIVGCRRR